ncbi:MAG: B12-binding domain-containing radical SAM protein, partial [Dehalococcoidia bacterium]
VDSVIPLAVRIPERPRDTSRPVILVGFYDQGNLGLGYLAATLRAHGYSVEVLDFERDQREILDAVLALQPAVVGFSLIFQLYIDRFDSLIRYLRAHGVAAHFTMGGHFPSLSYERTLDLLPGLDSVVRFEGELTLLELVDVISTAGEWQAIDGIAYRRDGAVVSNPLRQLIADLDTLPFPERIDTSNAILGRRSMQLVASRGCARTCSFCSIHMFYRIAPGKVVRTRRPAEVVREMRMLYDEHDITLFHFQDDDFPLFGAAWHRWANEFIDELYRADLPGHVLWKINCRADAVDLELFTAMRDAGLYFVYMGLESGTEEGLKTLNKQLTVEQNLRAVEILKQLDLLFEFGFMLFDPSTSFESITENLAFLRTIVGDGGDALSFCRMIPYDGTPIRDELEREGRLRGTVIAPDYDFLDPRIDALYHALRDVVEVTGWIHGLRGLSQLLNFVRSEAVVAERLFPPLEGMAEYKASIRAVTCASNGVLFAVMADTASAYSGGERSPWTAEALREQSDAFRARVVRARDSFVRRHQQTLLSALSRETARQPVYA